MKYGAAGASVGEFVQDVITFDVPSETEKGITYEVTLGDGFGRCTCAGYYWRSMVPRNAGKPAQSACKHLEAAFPLWYDIVKARRAEAAEPKTLVLHVPPGVTIEVA